MSKIAIITDSNSGISKDEAKELGVFIVPMPFMINGKQYYEDINLYQDDFYKLLLENAEISTSQPAIGEIMDLWTTLLKEFTEIVYIPMSSSLSKSCETATLLAQEDEFINKVFVVNNQRISVTQRQSCLDALYLASKGLSGHEIKDILEKQKFDSSIYIMVDNLKYLCKGGRCTASAATFANFFGIKPVLQIQGEKLDAFAKVRGTKKALKTMIDAMKKDIENRFGGMENIHMECAYTHNEQEALEFFDMIKKEFPNCIDYVISPLSLSISCHIGPGSLAIAVSKKID